jgi:hypothetical protein
VDPFQANRKKSSSFLKKVKKRLGIFDAIRYNRISGMSIKTSAVACEFGFKPGLPLGFRPEGFSSRPESLRTAPNLAVALFSCAVVELVHRSHRGRATREQAARRGASTRSNLLSTSQLDRAANLFTISNGWVLSCKTDLKHIFNPSSRSVSGPTACPPQC